MAQDTVNRLQGQSGPLSEAQKQELAEARGVLDGQTPAIPKKGPPHLTGTTKESVDHKAYHYLLNPQHPVGGPKSIWFRRALGFTQDNATELARQIVFDPSTAVPTEKTVHGQKFGQPIMVVGATAKPYVCGLFGSAMPTV